MKNSIVFTYTSALLALSAQAAPTKAVSESSKKYVCTVLRPELAKVSQRAVSTTECLAGDFKLQHETGAFLAIQWQGQTVEDLTTVCEVSLLKDITLEIKVPDPKCSLE